MASSTIKKPPLALMTPSTVLLDRSLGENDKMMSQEAAAYVMMQTDAYIYCNQTCTNALQ